eukprot:1159717-Pelagomonas_calceolata.AAC.10
MRSCQTRPSAVGMTCSLTLSTRPPPKRATPRPTRTQGEHLWTLVYFLDGVHPALTRRAGLCFYLFYKAGLGHTRVWA